MNICTDPAAYRLFFKQESYNRAFPRAPIHLVGNRLEGVWIMGNNYSGSGYYGSYPGNYIKRIRALFPDMDKLATLHLFSGSIEGQETVDINPNNFPTYCIDAESMSQHFGGVKYDLILADPPYNKEEAAKYGYKMINRRKVLAECHAILKPGGWLIWLDEVCPIFAKKNWHWGMFFPIFTSTNRRIRAVFGFRKVEG
jgi:hypothetical protein